MRQSQRAYEKLAESMSHGTPEERERVRSMSYITITTTGTYDEAYIPRSEYNKMRNNNLLVCAVCGLESHEGHCAIAHTDHDLRRTDPNYNGVLGMACSCPRCTPRC